MMTWVVDDVDDDVEDDDGDDGDDHDDDGDDGVECTGEDQSPAEALIESPANKGSRPINTISDWVGSDINIAI